MNQQTNLQNNGKHDSKVGKILSESTQKSVITLVLAMLVSAIVLDPPLFLEAPVGYSLGLKVLSSCYEDQVAYDAAMKAYQDSYNDDTAQLLLVFVGENRYTSSDKDPVSDLRDIEKQVSYYVSPDGDIASVAVHDMREFTRVSAILGMCLTLTICFVLASGSLLLSKVT